MKVGEDGVVMMLVKPVEGLKTIAGGIDLVALTRMSASSSRRTSPSSTTRMRFCPIVFEKPADGVPTGKGSPRRDSPNYCDRGTDNFLLPGGYFGHCAVRSHAWHFGQACAR